MVKEHTEVHPHTTFRGDRPVNSGDIQDQRFVRPKFLAPAAGAAYVSAPRGKVCLSPPQIPRNTPGLAAFGGKTREIFKFKILQRKKTGFFFAPASRPSPSRVRPGRAPGIADANDGSTHNQNYTKIGP